MCELFVYGGCGANDNNFETAEECMKTCPVTPCMKPTLSAEDELFDRYEGTSGNNDCKADSDCMRSGCSGEVCAADQQDTTCELVPKPAGGCHCVENQCQWSAPCEGKCCDPYQEPGKFGNPIGREGYQCCPGSGEWVFSIGDARTFPCPSGVMSTGPWGVACPCKECPQIKCPAAPEGCKLGPIIKDDCGCQTKCPEVICPKPCELPQVVGPCEAAIPRWWFNGASGKCEAFTYGGCQGNTNNFASEDECMGTCPSGMCNLYLR